MAKCVACGEEVSFWRMCPGKVCQACAIKRLERTRDESLTKLGAPPARCLAVITDVASQPEVLNLEVGDIFVAPEALVCIAYARETYAGNLAGLGGFLAGGAVGGLAAGLVNVQAVVRAKSNAEEARQADFGMTLEDRARKRNAEIIGRSEVDSIHADAVAGVIGIAYQGKTLKIGVGAAEAWREKLERWKAGELGEEAESQGVNLGLPAAAHLIGTLIAGTELPEASVAERIAQSEGYLDGFWPIFDRLSRARQEAIVRSVSRLPRSWTEASRQHLVARDMRARRGMRWAALGGFVGVVGLSYFLANFQQLDGEMTGAGFFALMASFSLTGSLPYVIGMAIESRRFRYFLALLEG